MLFCQFYYPDTRIYRRILDYVLRKQKGLCFGCSKPFEGNEILVRGNSKLPRYYHLPCAKPFNIIDEYDIETIMTEETSSREKRQGLF